PVSPGKCRSRLCGLRSSPELQLDAPLRLAHLGKEEALDLHAAIFDKPPLALEPEILLRVREELALFLGVPRHQIGARIDHAPGVRDDGLPAPDRRDRASGAG